MSCSSTIATLASGADWRPTANLASLHARAALLARIRAFFAAAGVLEVETPLLSRAAATDPALASLRVTGDLPDRDGGWYLHTSPEFAMKRLLAAGSGPIWQLCRVFRDGERGRLHHPEFSLLEWYRPGWETDRLMDEVADLARAALERPELPARRVAYRDLFRDELGLDPWTASLDDLRTAAVRAAIPDAATLDLDRDGWLDLLLTQCLEPGLGRDALTFLHDYPPSQAALARLRRDADGQTVAERFELYLDGIELANGFGELTDAAEQAARFDRDLERRRALGLSRPPRDDRLLAALAAGLPDSAGVALGIDRLLMLATGASRIDAVLAFPIERA